MYFLCIWCIYIGSTHFTALLFFWPQSMWKDKDYFSRVKPAEDSLNSKVELCELGSLKKTWHETNSDVNRVTGILVDGCLAWNATDLTSVCELMIVKLFMKCVPDFFCGWSKWTEGVLFAEGRWVHTNALSDFIHPELCSDWLKATNMQAKGLTFKCLLSEHEDERKLKNSGLIRAECKTVHIWLYTDSISGLKLFIFPLKVGFIY